MPAVKDPYENGIIWLIDEIDVLFSEKFFGKDGRENKVQQFEGNSKDKFHTKWKKWLETGESLRSSQSPNFPESVFNKQRKLFFRRKRARPYKEEFETTIKIQKKGKLNEITCDAKPNKGSYTYRLKITVTEEGKIEQHRRVIVKDEQETGYVNVPKDGYFARCMLEKLKSKDKESLNLIQKKAINAITEKQDPYRYELYYTLFQILYAAILTNSSIRAGHKTMIHSILGVSGSLSHLGEKEKEIIKDTFGFGGPADAQAEGKKVAFLKLPSFYGGGNLENGAKPDAKVEFSANEERQFEKIIQIIKKESKRPYVIFFLTHKQLDDFYEELKKAGYEDGNIKILRSDQPYGDADDETISEAGNLNRVTLAMRKFNRGIDFGVGDAVDERGGTMVISTFYPLDSKEEVQMKGRTARKNYKGEFRYCLSREGANIKHLTKQDGFQFDDITYGKLNEKRTQYFEADLEKRRLAYRTEVTEMRSYDELRRQVVRFLSNEASSLQERKKEVGKYLKKMNGIS